MTYHLKLWLKLIKWDHLVLVIRSQFLVFRIQLLHFFKIGKDKNHVKLTANKKDGNLAIVGFNKDYLNNNLLPFISKIFVTLSLNTYRKQVSLQGIMEGIAFASPKLAVPTSVIDLRQEKFVMGLADRYLLFDKKNIPIVKNSLQIDDDKISLVKDYDQSGETVALLDVPRNQVELNAALKKIINKFIYAFY